MEASGLEPIRPRAILPPSLFTREYLREGDQYLSTWYGSALGEVTEGEGTGEEDVANRAVPKRVPRDRPGRRDADADPEVLMAMLRP